MAMSQSELRARLADILSSYLGVYSKPNEPNEPAIRVGEPSLDWRVASGLECVIDEFPSFGSQGLTYDGNTVTETYRVYLVRHNSGDLKKACQAIIRYFGTAQATPVNSRSRVIDVPYYAVDIFEPEDRI